MWSARPQKAGMLKMHNDMALFVEFQGCAPMFPHSQKIINSHSISRTLNMAEFFWNESPEVL
jgi:hypothetical protein